MKEDSKFATAIPVKLGYTYTVTIESIGKEEDGIAKVDGFVVIVPDTNIGDEVKVEITKVSKRVAFGKVTEWLEE